MAKKNILLLLVALIVNGLAFAQVTPVKLQNKVNHFVYHSYDYGEQVDSVQMDVVFSNPMFLISTAEEEGPFVPGYAQENTVVNVAVDSAYDHVKFYNSSDEDIYEVAYTYGRKDIKFDTSEVGGLIRYVCSINSNTLEFYVQDFPVDINPLPYYGHFKGILVSFWRNGKQQLKLNQAYLDKKAEALVNESVGGTTFKRVSSRELSNIKRQKLIITNRIFDDEQICWGKANDHIDDNSWSLDKIPYDTVLHYAGGTLILKRVKLPVLPKHYQTFIELHQRSNGDAYDRTGSVFVIPEGYFGQTFFDGINNHPDSLPVFVGKDGQRYQGITAKTWTEGETVLRYLPPVELMRFFTPFGVGHFNDRVKIDGLEWENEAFYKQEVTDLSGYLQNAEGVLIGVWIGNYDGGGHKVTLDIKSYPGDYKWNSETCEGTDEFSQPLFNTCNVLEMAGQNYGKLFGTDSLSAEFWVGDTPLQLRYITTGHGGWDGGDEFNPKTNSILIDGKPIYSYTPWREDCGCYRKLNPVSGNFWNGMSSSDYSRSGWCPGTATQPVYFDVSFLEKGKHTITIAIPQGEEQYGSFSHWSVSGILINK